jgi:ubiquitin carboxyl-terminal hydrolase L5
MSFTAHQLKVATNSCATMAMLNIVNNVPELELGEHLESFKSFTRSLTPAQRGDALMHFDYVKRIHNSFARKSDILEADFAMKNRFVAASKRKQIAEKKLNNSTKSSKSKKKKTQHHDDEFKPNNSSRRSKIATDESDQRKSHRTGSWDIETSTSKKEKHLEYEGDAAFHFIAFIPISGEIWKLDGMNQHPVSLGPFEEGFGWLEAIRPIIGAIMAEAGGEISFNLMALLQDPLEDSRKSLAENICTLSVIQNTLDLQRSGWQNEDLGDDSKPLLEPSTEFGITRELLATTKIPQSIERQMEVADTSQLISLRQTWVNQQQRIRSDILEAMRRAEADQLKAADRRIDYGEFIAEWVTMLAEGEHIQPLVEELGL